MISLFSNVPGMATLGVVVLLSITDPSCVELGAPTGEGVADVHRWWDFDRGDHFYTTDPAGEIAPSSGYDYEGVGFALWTGPVPGSVPFYRWYSPFVLDHFYTTDPAGELAPGSGYEAEGILGYVLTSPEPGTLALHRWYNAGTGDHFYTTDPTGEVAPVNGYVYEGIVGYVLPPGSTGLAESDAGTDPPPPVEEPCPPGQVRENGVCVGDGRLRFTLAWDRPGDMDLRVVTPSGSEIYYGSRAADGGQLDRDDTTGTGPENIFWEASPPAGLYYVCVDPYRIDGPTRFTLTVATDGREQTFSGTRSSSDPEACAPDSPYLVTSVTVR